MLIFALSFRKKRVDAERTGEVLRVRSYCTVNLVISL